MTPSSSGSPAVNRPYMSHKQLRILIELDSLDDRLLHAQQTTP